MGIEFQCCKMETSWRSVLKGIEFNVARWKRPGAPPYNTTERRTALGNGRDAERRVIRHLPRQTAPVPGLSPAPSCPLHPQPREAEADPRSAARTLRAPWALIGSHAPPLSQSLRPGNVIGWLRSLAPSTELRGRESPQPLRGARRVPACPLQEWGAWAGDATGPPPCSALAGSGGEAGSPGPRREGAPPPPCL